MKTSFKIEFTTDNASFADFPRDTVAEVLNAIREAVYSGKTEGPIKDWNGNKIGYWHTPDGFERLGN